VNEVSQSKLPITYRFAHSVFYDPAFEADRFAFWRR
jgi:hypothetical protein